LGGVKKDFLIQLLDKIESGFHEINAWFMNPLSDIPADSEMLPNTLSSGSLLTGFCGGFVVSKQH
jgi:hypothetical protein